MSQNPIDVYNSTRWRFGESFANMFNLEKKTFNVNLFSPEEERRIKADASARYSKFKDFQTFSGSDIKALMYLPLLTKGSLYTSQAIKFKIFADLQTISISSTRSVSPVRVFGRSSPLGYTRGARTFAGSLVFATIRRDPFIDVADSSISESYINASTSMIADQLPPFSVIINAVNESGAAASQLIHGITITNYGTTYSVDDLYTETTYTYVATDVQVLTPEALKRTKGAGMNGTDAGNGSSFTNVTSLVESNMAVAYGTVDEIRNAAKKFDSDAAQMQNFLGRDRTNRF